MTITNITVRGARQHNLQDINVQIPRNTLTVITGLSGSGKSSLAFDTIYAEGQRRYVETLSAYARQFLDQIERPDVDSIEGLSPAISIEQKTTSRSPRSTVGTITEIYDYLRLLYASVGTPHCPNCGRPISRQSAEQIVERVLALPAGERLIVYAPIVRGRKGEFKDLLDSLDQQGFKARVDGEVCDLADPISLEKRKNHTIEAIVDRVVLKPGVEKRLEAAVAKALQLANGLVLIGNAGGEQLYSSSMACPDCGLDVPKLEPRSFSFNSTYGACPECHGLGSIYDFDAAKVVIDWSKPLLEGALGPGSGSQYLARLVKLAAQKYKIPIQKPFEQLTEKQQELLLYGPGAEAPRTGFHGVFAWLRDSLEESKSDSYREWLLGYMSATTCPVCHGKRLRPASLAVKVNKLSIADFTGLPLGRALNAARSLSFSQREALIADRLRREIVERLEFLNAVGLSYLSLDRNAASLSGGEGQRIRLATQIGSRLRGVLYVLDEPSIGLHQRDNQRLIAALESLRDLGNTVLVVEHDEDTIRSADYVLDLGPGAGKLGGHVVAEGTPANIMEAPGSLTGRYLSGATSILHRPEPRLVNGAWVTVEGARSHNLRNITARFPLNVMTVVTGVSGSGKSTLVNDILYRSLARTIYDSRESPGEHKSVKGVEQIDKVIRIDQSPIGRTPRSNPATYTGVLSAIRDIFAMLPEARERGYKPGRFSFNVAGGRCEACQGDGQKRIEMNFLPDVYVLCDVCNGRRFNQETLAVKFNGYSIADILDLAIEDALPVLKDIPQVRQKLQTLVDVGLGYVHLGQAATTLSGGEAQRMKLARELSKRQTGKTLYVLDEPTTGLHFDDVRKLLEVLHRLTDLGNTVIIIEHNLDVIRNADWIIDLGPEGGEDGGAIVAEGTPAQVAQIAASHTAGFLRRYFPVDASIESSVASIPEAKAAMANGRVKRTRAAVLLQSSSKQTMPIDPSFLPPAASPEEPAAQPESPPPLAATPHIGHTLLFGGFVLLALIFVIVAFGLSLKHIGPHLGETIEQMQTDPRVVLPVEGIWYVIAAATSILIFPLVWARSFAQGIHWRAFIVGRRWWLLVSIGVVTSVVVQILSNFLPIPKDLPIDKFFTNRIGVWLVVIFGVAVAPPSEELAFRGFLLPSLASAWDWVMKQRVRTPRELVVGAPAAHRPTESEWQHATVYASLPPERASVFDRMGSDPNSSTEGDSGPSDPRWSMPALVFSTIITSIAFTAMHGAQLAHSFAPLAVLFAVSVVLCITRLRFHSLAASTVVHSMYNATIFVMLFIGTDGFRHLDKLGK